MSSDVPDPDVKIDDPEGLSQTQRIQELLDRRRRVIDARDELYDLALLDDQGRDQVRQAYRSRIESLIIDVWTTLQEGANADGGGQLQDGATADGGQPAAKQYLEHEPIAEIEVPPPEDFQPGEGEDRLGPKQPTPEPKYETIRGLRWFLDNQGPIQKTFEVRTFSPPTSQTRTREVPVPMAALDKALVTVVEWLSEAGIDADLQEAEQQTKITRELLEEVEEWRKQNVE